MANKTSGWDQLPFKDIFTSKLIRFLVGPDQCEFMIHKEIIARLSPALDALLNGHMKEAVEGIVEWDDLDENTFTRFAQYAYTGNYDAAEPEMQVDWLPSPAEEESSPPTDKKNPAHKGPTATSSNNDGGQDFMFSEDDDLDRDSSDGDPEHSDSGSDSSDSDDDSDHSAHNYATFPLCPEFVLECPPFPSAFSIEGFISWADDSCPGVSECGTEQRDYPSKKRKLGRQLKPKEVDKHAFDCPVQSKKYKLHHEFRGKCQDITGDDDSVFQPRKNTEPHECYARVFMSHMTLYILADKYRIPALGKKAMSRLLRTLHGFTVYHERIPDIIALIRFCYENTVATDPLRKALAFYASCVVDDIGNHEQFRDLLLVEAGNFSADMMVSLMKRID